MRVWPGLVLFFVGSFVPFSRAQLPPLRSTVYDGSSTLLMRFPSRVYSPNQSMTVEAWVYREDASRCETVVSQDYRSSFWLGFCSGSLRFYRSGGAFADADRNVSAHRWTHVAAAYDGASSQVSFYIDGIFVSTKALASTGGTTAAPLYLGMTPPGSFGGNYPLLGALDEVRIWKTALVGSDINSGRMRELVAGGDLVASFPTGGNFETGTAHSAEAYNNTHEQVYGILPRNLVLPRRPAFDGIDGDITTPKYGGAEVMALRYLQAGVEVDAPVYLNAAFNSGIPYVYVGLGGLQPNGHMGNNDGAGLSWSFGVAEAGVTFPNSTDKRVTAFYNSAPNQFWKGNGTNFSTADSAPTATIAKSFCDGDVNPVCVEMRGSFPSGAPRAMMLDLYWPGPFVGSDRRFLAPFDAVMNDPTTWPTITIGSTVGASETVRVKVQVEEVLDIAAGPSPVANALVRLQDGSLNELATARTGPDGTVTLSATVRTNTALHVELAEANYWPRLGARAVDGTGVLPESTGIGSVNFAACTGCSYATVVFTTRAIPEGSTAVTGFTPGTDHFKRTRLRDSPLLELAPTEITITGTNLHMSTEVYLTTCDRFVFSDTSTTPAAATGCDGATFYPVTVLAVSADHRNLRVRLDNEAAPSGTSLKVLLRDIPSRDGRRQWTYIPGSVFFGEPPYPLVHGFSFFNDRDGTDFNEFSSVYQWQAYDCITPIGPIPPVQTCIGCRTPNPIYATYFAVMFAGWVDLMPGSCLGMSSTSLLFARGDLRAEDLDAGVHYASGFLGGGAEFRDPPRPHSNRARGCDYAVPVNLWAHIHRNQAVQTSQEFLSSVIGQMVGTGIGTTSYSIAGDPNAALARIRGNMRGHVLCFQNGADFFQSHCVTPWRILDGKGASDDGSTLVDRADSSVVLVYDSNWPGKMDRFFEINHTRNEFRYQFTIRRTPSGDVPEVWSGKGMYAEPITIWQNARSMPGAELLARGLMLLVFGSADGRYTDASGGEWGWDSVGTFHGTYDGAKAFAPPADVDDAANRSRSVLFFPPTNSPPTSIQVNVRGPNWKFQASEGGTLAQLEVPGGETGTIANLKLHLEDGMMRGFRVSASRGMSAFTPTLGLNLGTNPAVVFKWEGISSLPSKSAEFVARHEKMGAEFLNDTGGAAQPYVRMLRNDSEGLKTNVFGPFNTPVGSTLLAAVVDSSTADTLRIELDLDRDGNADVVSFVTPATKAPPPPPTMTAETQKDGTILVEWPVNGGAWSLEFTSALDAGAAWKPESAQPTFANGRASISLPADDDRRFLRLRNAF